MYISVAYFVYMPFFAAYDFYDEYYESRGAFFALSLFMGACHNWCKPHPALD